MGDLLSNYRPCHHWEFRGAEVSVSFCLIAFAIFNGWPPGHT